MKSQDIKKLPYRNNVSCIVYRDKEFLLLQHKMWPINWWKFPQGGTNIDETFEKAAKRELKEETGTDSYNIIGVSKYTNSYDWNDESLKLASYRWRGQYQKYLLVEYLGRKDDININTNEIQDYKWVELEDIWDHIDHDDKNFTNYKDTVKKVLKEFDFL